jgi:signal peptidase I
MRRGFPSRSAGLVVAAALLGLTVGAAIRSFAYYPLRVTSNSMFPTVVAGDWVVISARRPGSDVPVDRGDIVLFTFPFGGPGRAIKRVVAVAGDEVSTAGPNVVLVNGDEASWGSSGHSPDEIREKSADAALRIPEGYVYILGDNVRSSIDSRSLGLLPQAEVLGKVAAVIKKPW